MLRFQSSQIYKLLRPSKYKICKANFHNNTNNKQCFATSIPYSKESFYDWKDPKTYVKVIQDQYTLNDLFEGYKAIKSQMQATNRVNFTEQQLNFFIYTFLLYPQHQQILQDFLQGLDHQNKVEGAATTFPHYLHLGKQMLFYQFIDKQAKQRLTKSLQMRIQHQDNISSMQKLHKTLRVVSCFELGDLHLIYKQFKKLISEDLKGTNFKMSSKTIKEAIQIYEDLYFNDPRHLRNSTFLADFPDFEHDQQLFQNLLVLLPQMITLNFAARLPVFDIQGLNKRISTCTGFKSPETKKLLEDYSSHLVIIDKIEVVNFVNLLQKI